MVLEIQLAGIRVLNCQTRITNTANATGNSQSYDMEKMRGIGLRGFTVDENERFFPYEFKSLKGLETAKIKQQPFLQKHSRNRDEDWKGIEYSNIQLSDLTPLQNLKNWKFLDFQQYWGYKSVKRFNVKGIIHFYNRIKDISSLEKLIIGKFWFFKKWSFKYGCG